MPLSAFAEIRRDRGPNYILRENVERRVVVTANVAGRDLHSVYEDVRARVGERVTPPPGVRIEYAGQFERAEAARGRLLQQLHRAVVERTRQFVERQAAVGNETVHRLDDFALLGGDGSILGNPVHYRDPRNEGMLAAAAEIVPRDASGAPDPAGFIGFVSISTALSSSMCLT